ncbi:MAG: hypothetical protein HQ557_05090 [Bacteroidetes bacterium]|nr:hypothetical protein [Bacteroidota bacterium]
MAITRCHFQGKKQSYLCDFIGKAKSWVRTPGIGEENGLGMSEKDTLPSDLTEEYAYVERWYESTREL